MFVYIYTLDIKIKGYKSYAFSKRSCCIFCNNSFLMYINLYPVIRPRILSLTHFLILLSKKRETITASSSCPHPDIQKASIRRSLFITTDATSLLSLTSQLPCLFHHAFLVSRSPTSTCSFRSNLTLPLPLRILNFNSQTYCIYHPKTTTHMIPRYLCSS